MTGMRLASSYLHQSATTYVEVPYSVAAWLAGHADLLALRRLAAAERNHDVVQALAAMAQAAEQVRTSPTSANVGKFLASSAEVRQPLQSMSTQQAADALNLTPRAVRLACAEKRLTATVDANGHWRITPAALANYWRAA